MTGPFADRLFCIAFAAAGIYNLAFGLWAAVWPLSFFQLVDLPAPRYPGIWACLGMVVGLYGLLYLYAAWKLETAWPVIAVGLLGKVLGPIGMAISLGDEFPRRAAMLCVFNDLVWWLPFGLFLVRGTAIGRWLGRLAPWLCVVAHVVAIAMLAMVLQHGGVTEPDNAVRAQYIAAHPNAWAIGWSTWMIAAASLVGFYAWWGSRLAAEHIAIAAVVVAAFGMICDFSGEGLLILTLVERASTTNNPAIALGGIERAFIWLSAGMANGLYTIGGVMLTLATPDVPTWVRFAMWLTWCAGAAMTVAAILNSIVGMIISTALLFPPLLLVAAWMGARWRQA